MPYFIKKILYNFLLTFRYVRGEVKHYHSGMGKSKFRILLDLISWYSREHEFNKMYYAWGLNISNKQQEHYIGRREFLKIKNRVEKLLKKQCGCPELNYDVITKDKFYANSIFKANGVPCIPNVAVIFNSKIVFPESQVKGLDAIFGLKDTFFVKNTVLEAGDGVLTCRIMDDQIMVNDDLVSLKTFTNKLQNKTWVVQDQFHSHQDIKKLNPTALNTTRIVTIMNGTEPEYLTGFQAFATNNATTDSWSKNSVYVGIDVENLCLKEFGFYNLDVKDKSLVTEHPDSHIKFKDYKLPYLKEAVELCIRAHNLLFFNFVIGWDVAITDEGPFIVEANEKPGMNAVQCIDAGLRNAIRQHADKYLKRE